MVQLDLFSLPALRHFPGTGPAPAFEPASFTASSPLHTAANLLGAIAVHHADQPLPMLRSTAAHFARYIGIPVADLDLSMIRAAMAGFPNYLGQLRSRQGKPLAPNSIASYTHHAHLLLRLAESLGWRPTPSRAENAWNRLLADIQLPTGCRALVRFAIARELTPAQFADKDFDTFIALKADTGQRPKYSRKLVRAFRRMIAAAGLGGEFPLITPHRRDYFFGIPFVAMPEPLQSELRALIHFKTQPGRRLPRVTRAGSGIDHNRRPRRDIRIRAVSARPIESTVIRLFGFAVQELSIPPQWYDWPARPRRRTGHRCLHRLVARCPQDFRFKLHQSASFSCSRLKTVNRHHHKWCIFHPAECGIFSQY